MFLLTKALTSIYHRQLTETISWNEMIMPAEGLGPTVNNVVINV